MIIGILITSVPPFLFMVANQTWHIYAAQVLHGIGMALVIPSWSAIFTRHIDKGDEAFDWSVRSTSLGLAIGISGAVGGVLASTILNK
jgi:MFS family permease